MSRKSAMDSFHEHNHPEENLKKTSSTYQRDSSTEKKKKENLPENLFSKRPNTVSGDSRKRPGSSEQVRPNKTPEQPSSNSISHASTISSLSGNSNTTGKRPTSSAKSRKNPAKVNGKYIECITDPDFTSLLSKLLDEHEQIMHEFCAEREDFQRQIVEKIQSRRKTERGDFSSESRNFSSFENALSGVLEEIFQAWVHLFFFVMNLKINLGRILSTAEYELCLRPDHTLENGLVGQAIECVKFYSKLKIKSMVDALDELQFSSDKSLSETHIQSGEERVVSLFLTEMEILQKRGRHLLDEAKKEKRFAIT